MSLAPAHFHLTGSPPNGDAVAIRAERTGSGEDEESTDALCRRLGGRGIAAVPPRNSHRGRPVQRAHVPPVRAAGPVSFDSRIRGMDTRIEWLEQAADHSHKVFERAKQLHDELAAKLRPLTKPAPALANELRVLARRLEEASAKRLEADAQLAQAKQERDRLVAARAQAP